MILYSILSTSADETTSQNSTLYSQFLPNPVRVQIFTPNQFESDNEYPLLYLLHGYSSDYTQWNEITDLQQVADEFGFIIVSPDGFRTFFMNSPVTRTFRYESFFFEELVPFVHDNFRIDNSSIFISGLSMGGFGALNLMLADPGYFAAAGSTSGAVEFEYTFWKKISHSYLGNNMLVDDLELILGSQSDTSDYWYKKSLTSRIDEFKEAGVPIILDSGREDPLFDINQNLVTRLRKQMVPVHFFALPGGHNQDYWKFSIHHHFDFFARLDDAGGDF